jgi:hypothetical protein
MGRWNGAYFDSFVRISKDGHYPDTFERDHWFISEFGQKDIVATVPLTLRWSSILAIIRQGKTEALPDSEDRSEIIEANWEISRTAHQLGGFIRPAHYWMAAIPSRKYRFANNMTEMMHIYSGSAHYLGPYKDDGFPWPRVVPSLALKTEFRGVENLRLHPDCQAFYFWHGPKRVTGLYRRHLWPEPSEDPLFAVMWRKAFTFLSAATWSADTMPAIDDRNKGLLDRGYSSEEEIKTSTGREAVDLFRIQLADAQEAIRFGEAAESDFLAEMDALAGIGRKRDALRSAIRALRSSQNSMMHLMNTATMLSQLNRGRWADKVAEYAARIEPEHPWISLIRAHQAIRCGDYLHAKALLDSGYSEADFKVGRIPRSSFLSPRVTVCCILGVWETMERDLELLAEDDIVPNAPYLARKVAEARAVLAETPESPLRTSERLHGKAEIEIVCS